MLNTWHHDLAKLLCELAREADMRAYCEHMAIELPIPGVTGETEDGTEIKQGDPSG